MKSIFHLDSPVMSFLSKLADLMLLNVIYLIACLPVLSVGAATTALYSVMFHMDKNEDVCIFRQYWQAFRSNFKNATLLLLLLLVPLALAVYYFLLLLGGIFTAYPFKSLPFLIPVVLFCFTWTYVWPLQALFENAPLHTLRNACILSIGNLHVTLVCTILNLLLPILFLFFRHYFIRSVIFWVLMGFSLIAKANAKLLLYVFRKFFPHKEDEEKLNP